MVLQHIKGVSQKVKEEVIPLVESHLQDTIAKVLKNNNLAVNR
jgi:hypothetical protein